MHRVFISLLIVIGTHCGSSFTSFENSTGKSYRWTKAIDTGVKTWPRWVKPVLGGDGKLRMISEYETFTSPDGINWLSAKNDVQRAIRPGVSQIFFNGEFWMMGGMNNWAEFTNEIWTSPDAFDWTRVAEHAPWPARRNALLLEFNQKLFLLGGSESSGKKDVLPQRSFTDAWETADGSLWTKISDTVPPNAEQALVFQNQMWTLGAGGAWSSTDGKTWQQKASGKPFSNRGSFGAAVYDGKLWVFGGVDAEKTMNEVWSSNDGSNWEQLPNAPWFPRGAEYSTVFAGKLWIFGGKTGREYDQADDVWFMSR